MATGTSNLREGRSFARGIRAARAAAVSFCILSGLGFRALHNALNRNSEAVSFAVGTLEQVPQMFGACDDHASPAPCWRGESGTLDAALVERMGADDHIYRTYLEASGRPGPIRLLVTCGARPRDLQPHRPEVCYPAAGWMLRENREVEDLTPEGALLRGRLQQFVRGGLSMEQVWVLSYYIVAGRIEPDLGIVRARAWQSRGGIDYLAMVEVVAPVGRHVEEAAERAREFASLSAEGIRRVLVDAAQSVDAGEEPDRLRGSNRSRPQALERE